RELRQDAGLTILAAAESTDYSNYDRWESGATRVGPQHLRNIAQALAITDELGLFIYAWLVDRFSPTPGHGR
ncbi:MAG: helix-turn-helix domain-containing protein, partial [Acidimicrobiales bacterium]